MSDLGREYTPAEERINRIFDRLDQKIREIIMTSADETFNKVADQLGKAKGEIDTLLSSLEDAAVSDAVRQKVSDAAQALDDIVPDVTPEPGPEPEPTPEQ